jgi:ATP-dependent RNA helicase DeaD
MSPGDPGINSTNIIRTIRNAESSSIRKLTVPEIRQIYFEVKEKMKLDLLTRLIDMHNLKLALVFCNTKRRVDRLVKSLTNSRIFCRWTLMGDMSQNQRDRVMVQVQEGPDRDSG